MNYITPNGVVLEVNEEEDRLEPALDEQLPLEVHSSGDGCFIYDNHGAEVGYTYKQDWEKDPKGHIVWMAEEVQEVYEDPVAALTQATQYEPMFLFYDTEYPTDDVSCKMTNERTFSGNRTLPPLEEREEIDPQNSSLTVETEDRYTADRPSVVRIIDDGEAVRKWEIEHTENEDKNAELGTEIAWSIRLAYERPRVLLS